MAEKKKLVVPVFISHRGCPHQCLFCNQFSISGERSAVDDDSQLVDRTIAEWLPGGRRHEEVQVAFYGGSFTCLDDEEQLAFLRVVQPHIKQGMVDSIRLSTRPDCIDGERIDLLRAFGVRTVELGVQSLDDIVLRRSARGHTARDSIRAIKKLKDSGFEVGVQLLPGLPEETTKSFLDGVKRVVELRPDMVRIYPAVVVEGSPLAGLHRAGKYRPLTMNRAIALTRRAREIFTAAGVRVVRMGLQHSDTLVDELVAGPYHPSFGEIVVSRQWLREIRKRLSMLAEGETLTIRISDRDLSAVSGMRKMNIDRLHELGFGGRFRIETEKERLRGSVEYVVD